MPLLALLAVVVVLAAVLTGNSLARHLAASVPAPAAVATSDEASHHAAPAPALVPDEGSEAPGQAGQHVLHAVGACLAVLVVGLLVLHAVAFARWPRPPSQAACRPRAGPRPVSAWRPRALSPPTLSPVIRT